MIVSPSETGDNEHEMYGGFQKKLKRVRVALSLYLTFSILAGSFGDGIIRPFVPTAEAAEKTIDSDVSITVTEQLKSGPATVFTTDQTGYKFFVDALGYCVYRKTTDGGGTWGATTTVDSQTDCTQVSVWYDKWTPGSASSSIHIATLDPSADDIWYNRLDTDGDTLLLGSSPVSMLTGTGQGGTTLTAGENFVSITRATNGTIYTVSNDGTGAAFDSFILECTNNCNLAASWTETTPLPLDAASDQNILVPLADGDIMIIQRDISANLLRSRIWDDSAGSWLAWTTIDPVGGGDNTTYDVGFAATVSSSTPGNVYLAYAADYDAIGGDEDVRVGYYNGTGWATSTLTNVISNNAARGITGVAIALDTSNEDVYVAYSARTTPGTANTGNIYWKTATSSMQNWSAEQGPVNASADDIYGVDLNIASDERIHVSWYEAGPDDIFADTLADIFPGVHASGTGIQTASTTASSTNVYLGGRFLLYDTYKSHDITGITITEGGTIDGATDISNIELYYDLDTSNPYNCASESYGGAESQFGSTDTNGFSGANGVSSFTGSTVEVSTTTSLCLYVVLDVKDSTQSSSTIDISIADPSTDITVTNSIAGPPSSQGIASSTLVYNDTPTLTHYHWRNDDTTEALATSKTGGVEDTSLTSMRQGSTTRLRVEVSNEGSSSTPAMQYRIEYAPNPSTCDVATGWTDVGATGGDFDMSDSSHLTEGSDTTNIAVGIGGVTDSNPTFLTPNAGVKDTSSQTGDIMLSPTQFVELEYSIIASTTATEGNTYCFRVTNQGDPLFAYDQFPRANIASDVLVTVATSSQTTSTTTPATNFYVGSAFVITENTSTRNVTSIMITENGTVDGQTDLDNIRLQYDLDTTAPYNCAGESYGGSEAQFGSTDTDGFSGPNGTSTFTGSVAISTTSTMCLYTVLDTTTSAQNGQTIDIIMESPSANLVVSGGGSVSPSITRDMNGVTTLVGAVLTQTHYHWRSDNGSEAAATSLSGGAEDIPVTNVAQITPVRLRMQVSNEGGVTSASRALRLEYGAKITTCSAVSAWTDVGATGGAWEMYNSINLTEGNDTTNIAVGIGGVTDENTTFLTPNSAVKETSSVVASTTITASQYLETEHSIQQTTDAGFDVTYCFRLSPTDIELDSYLVYPELTTSPERDFEIQRRTENFASSSLTLYAGIDYTAPSASTSAFVRITNTNYMGAGDSSTGGNQAADDVTAYIADASNVMTSFRIARPAGAAATTTRVSWEIIEFIGEAGSDNEMIVRSQTSLAYTTTSLTATGTAASGITDDADVVVFITGQGHPDTATTNYNSGQSTSAWLASSDQPVFTRGVAGGDATIVSYAVVEFTGQNWAVQRSEHTYSSAGSTETEEITPVNSTSRAFLHAQKRIITGLTGGDEFGHEVWLSGMGQVSYFLQTGAATPSGQTSVAWVIENTQTADGAMVVYRSNNTLTAGTPEPSTFSVSINGTLEDITNASIFINNRSAETGTAFPRPIIGAIIASTTHYELWRSDTGTAVDYRTEVVEWPTAGLAIKQNHYQFYVDNNALTPTEAWPGADGPLGEDTVLTGSDEPLGEGERIRIRMSIQALNATFPAGTRAFKLQYGQLTTTCSAISAANWTTLGNSASSTIWRGYNATGTTDGTLLSGDPPTGGDLVLPSVSDVAGTLEEENDTDVNTYAVQAGEDMEFDWIVEQNGANAETYYCFRMVDSDGTPLDSYSTTYPQLRTATFSPRTQDWRWFTDESHETPTSSLAAINVAPIDIVNGEIVKLRVTVAEIKNIARDDVRFRLQYSEYANFSQSFDVVATSTCTATSTWCYANGGGADNAIIASTTLTDGDACVAGIGNGCGTHNESSDILTGFRHEGNAAAEYEFTIQSAGPHTNRVYFFRLYDSVQDIPVVTNIGESYPSLVTEGASLVFEMEGIASSTVVEGITTDFQTTPTTVPFGRVPLDSSIEGVHRILIDTNGTQGYQLFMMLAGDLLTSAGSMIEPITGTNASPVAWNTGCVGTAVSCLGYHTSDDTLQGGSTRFSAIDTYARFSTTTLEEVAYTSQPVVGDTVDIVFRLLVRSLQDAGQYETNIRYVSVPMF